jgi:hypothetical protein
MQVGADFPDMTHESPSTTRSASKKFSMLGAALTLLTPAFFAGCGSDNKPTEMTVPAVDVVVGAMLPRTGPNANSDWISAVELALKDVNSAITKAKMAKPIHFTLNELDTASNEAMAFAAMQTYSTAGAKVVLTEASNAAIGANKWNYTDANVTAGTQLPVISFTATSGSLNKMAPATETDPARAGALTDANNWFFRTCPASDALSALRLSQVFGEGADVNGDGKIKVVWIGSSDTSTVASINGDKTAFQNYVNLPANAALVDKYIAESVVFDPGATPETYDYGHAITLATDAFLNDGMNATTADFKPDLIINKALPTIAIPFIKAYKQNSANTIAIFQDGSFRRNTLLASLGSTADGQRGVSNIAYEASPGGDVFKTEQQAVTGFPPAAYESQGYDAAVLGMLAIIKASITKGDIATVTGAEVQAALGDLNHFDDATALKFYTGDVEIAKGIAAIGAATPTPVDYSGASGNVNFDTVGNVFDRAVLWTIAGGQFVEQSYFDCGAVGTNCDKLANRTTFGTIKP